MFVALHTYFRIAAFMYAGAVALGVEYEYSDRTKAKMKDPDGYELGQTEDIKAMMKPVHTLRVGAEFKLAPEFSFRLGYNHITDPLKSDAFKYPPVNSIRTDTEFSNPGATNNYTFGCGYRGEINGLMTYDRKVIKMNEAKVREINQQICNSLNK